MGSAKTIFLLLISCLAVWAFMALDAGLSGGSAQDPTPGFLYIAIAVGLMFVIGSGAGGEGAETLGSIFGLLPMLALLAFCAVSQAEYEDRPEARAQRALSEDIRCSVEQAGLSAEDRPFVRARIGMIADNGEVGDQVLQREIEGRMGIKILPKCGFERSDHRNI